MQKITQKVISVLFNPHLIILIVSTAALIHIFYLAKHPGSDSNAKPAAASAP